LVAPAIILADINPGPTPNTLNLTVTDIINLLLNFIWPIFIGFAVLMFLIAGFQFLLSQGDPSKIGQARQFILWGIIGVVVGLIAFSLPFIIRATLGL
jgi:hypothetical protein